VTTIRPANLTDLNALVALGRVMHAESPRMGRMEYAELKAKATLAGLIASPDNCLLLVADEGGKLVGGIAAAIEEHWFSNDKMAYDLALFVHPDKRGGMTAARLLNAYAHWAKEKGARITQFGISTGVNLETTGALAEKLGFERSGVLFDVAE
jgi:GNAT superfamily N-acetyltransferase